MRILLFIGDHLRHLYFANKINKSFPLDGIIIEKRESQIPDFSNLMNQNDKKIAEIHFENRLINEKKYFKKQNTKKLNNILNVSNINKQNQECINFVKNIKPTLVFSFGVSIIKGELFKILPKNKINLHSGLLPYFRGKAGNFWPFYFLQPNWCGYTFHFIEKTVDKGSIIHHSVPKLKNNETIHEVSCKALIKASNDVINIIRMAQITKNIPSNYINDQGKYFSSSDFKIHHLRMIYNYFNDDIVNYHLNNLSSKNEPKIIKLV